MIPKYDTEENYCSFVPDKLFGVNFNFGCYQHDRQYRNEVVKRKTRKEADTMMRSIILKKYIAKNKKYIGLFVSSIYYYGVRIFARKAWTK